MASRGTAFSRHSRGIVPYPFVASKQSPAALACFIRSAPAQPLASACPVSNSHGDEFVCPSLRKPVPNQRKRRRGSPNGEFAGSSARFVATVERAAPHGASAHACVSCGVPLQYPLEMQIELLREVLLRHACAGLRRLGTRLGRRRLSWKSRRAYLPLGSPLRFWRTKVPSISLPSISGSPDG